MPDSSFEDRFAIRELYSRYAHAAACKNGDTWLACWAEDAVWKTPHFEISGRIDLGGMWEATWVNFSNVAAFTEVGDILIAGDTAKAGCTVLEIMTLSSGGLTKMAGLYEDELVRENGQWRFSRRVYSLLSQE